LLVGQIISSAAITTTGWRAWHTFPIRQSRPLGEDAADLRRFIISSSAATSLTSGRATLGTWLIGAIAPFWQAAYFRNAQAPLTAMAAISSPARLVLLAEQTADYERGHRDRVRRLLKRYILFSALVMCVAVPVGWFLMPYVMAIYGHRFRLHATTAARVVLFVGALQFVSGFSKTLPVSIGRPNLRVISHGIEVLVFIPLLVVFGHYWGATGGALAMLASTAVFVVVWAWLLYDLRDALANIAPAEVV
jgi:O-antigen/teichoic acid export membrane protein